MRHHLVGLLCLISASGCGGCGAPPDEVANVKCATAVELEPVKTDILFVIDNSCSMTQKQDALAESLSEFADRLKKAELKQDFQVGIVTTSIWQHTADDRGVPELWPDESGRLQQAKRSDGTRTPKVLRYDSPTFLEDFKAVVRVGNKGSGQETHLEAAWRAVGTVGSAPLITRKQEDGGNQGLLRDGARLLIITLTDEDDCSERAEAPSVVIGGDLTVDYCDDQRQKLTDPRNYYEFFRGLKDSFGRPRQISFAAIAPVALTDKGVQRVNDTVIDSSGNKVPGFHNIDCPGSFGVGRRILAFAQMFGPVTRTVDSICNPSYRETLLSFAKFVEANNELELKVPPPDPNLMVIDVTRADGTVQHCAFSEKEPNPNASTGPKGSFLYAPADSDKKARVIMRGACERRPDDEKIELKLVCAS